MNNLLYHLKRTEAYRIPEQAWQHRPQGNRNVGRPMKRPDLRTGTDQQHSNRVFDDNTQMCNKLKKVVWKIRR
jgi:hypothetical protein